MEGGAIVIKKIKVILIILCFFVFAISLNFILQKYIQDAQNKIAYNNLIKLAIKSTKENNVNQFNNAESNIKDEHTNNINNEVNSIEEISIPNVLSINNTQNLSYKNEKIGYNSTNAIENNKNNSKINWNELFSINKDIIGWIEIPNTNINYPILLDENSFYINHNFQKKVNHNGSIFIRSGDILENNEINIYGHNMKNGTMFAKLANYINKDFFEKNSKIYVYTKNHTYEGNIFSAYSKGIEEENKAIQSLNFNEKINYYKSQSVNLGETKENINKIVKLVTCSYLNAKTSPTDQRYYVIAEISEIY